MRIEKCELEISNYCAIECDINTDRIECDINTDRIECDINTEAAFTE